MTSKKIWSKFKRWQMQGVTRFLLRCFLAPFYTLWCFTLRYSEEGRKPCCEHMVKHGPLVFSLWHDEVFPLMYKRGEWNVATIVSQNKDAETLAILLEKLGLAVVRGSSSKGGLRALLKISKLLRESNTNACITVDGPRGPRHKVKEGAIFLAYKTPAYIVPIRLFSSKAKVFKSWDRFQLPLPFSKVHIAYGEPYLVDIQDLTPENLTKACRDLEERLELLEPPAEFYQSPVKYKIYLKLTGFLQKLSLRNLHRIGKFFGCLAWYFMPKRKNLAIVSIKKHLNVPDYEAKRIARQSFDENFKSFLEIFYAKRLYESGILNTCTPHPLLRQLHAENIPVVVATGHIGSWELLEPYAAAYTTADERLVVVREQKDKTLDKIMIELRSSSGLTAIGHRDASFMVSKCLKNKGFTAFLVDHNASLKESILLPFLGENAAVNIGPALLALRAKAAVYPVFLLRDGLGSTILHMGDPLYTADLKGSINERVKIIAEYYTKAVENVVRLYPEQWFWMHQRWKNNKE